MICPQLALWYLVCLFYWRFFTWYFKDASPITMLVVSFLLLVVCGFIPIDHEFSFQRTFAFMPYFIIGYLFKRNNMMSMIESIPTFLTIVIMVMSLIMARFLPFYMPKVHFYSMNDVFVRMFQTCLGIILCLSIIRLSRMRFWERIAKYGKYTIWIYIGHTYLIVIGQKISFIYGLRINIFEAIVLAFLYCFLLILLAKTFENRKNIVSQLQLR